MAPTSSSVSAPARDYREFVARVQQLDAEFQRAVAVEEVAYIGTVDPRQCLRSEEDAQLA